MENRRNENGFKDCCNCYLEGGKWEQWTDETGASGTREEADKFLAENKEKFPDKEFKLKKIDGKDGFYRIYALAT